MMKFIFDMQMNIQVIQLIIILDVCNHTCPKYPK